MSPETDDTDAAVQSALAPAEPAAVEEMAPAFEEDAPAADQEQDALTVRPAAFAPLEEGAADAAPGDGPRPLDLLLDIEVPVVVELGHTEMPIEDLLALKPGAVIELDRLASEPVDLLIRDHVVARGEVVVIDDTLGLRITSILDPSDRVRHLGDG